MADLVQLLNERALTALDGVWVSQSLNRTDLGRVYTLPYVTLLYSAEEETSIEVAASPDGGASWPVTKMLTLVATSMDVDEVGRVSVALRVTGHDLRLRLTFDQADLAHVHVYIPPLIERGKHQNAAR